MGQATPLKAVVGEKGCLTRSYQHMRAESHIKIKFSQDGFTTDTMTKSFQTTSFMIHCNKKQGVGQTFMHVKCG
jgi:hypothetical protein